MMKRKGGQAAMEFLMTYGWAILAAVIVIAVLAYFGVFSPSTYVPNSCTLSAPLGCNGGVAVANSTDITFELKNGAGESITAVNVSISGCSSTTIATVGSNDMPTVIVPCTNNAGDKFKGDVTVRYKKAGSALELTSSGSIIAKVA